MSDFKLSTTFTGLDKFSPTLKAMGANVQKFATDSRRHLSRTNQALRGIGNTAKNILGAAGIVGGAAMVGLAIRKVTTEFVELDDALTSAGAKFNKPILRGTKAFEEFGRVARQVGKSTEFSATEAAQGLEYLASSGFDAKQSMMALPSVVNLATIANMNLEKAVNFASDALGAFGLKAKDPVQLQKNLTRLNDVFAKTGVSASFLFDAIKSGGLAFNNAGQSLETFNTLVAALENAGVKGSEAGMAMKSMMTKLALPTSSAAKTLQNLGIKTKDSKGNFRDAIDILGDFEKSTKNMGNAQKIAALSTVFGSKSVNFMSVLLSKGSDNLRVFRQDLLNAGGAGDKMAEIMRGSIGKQLKMMENAAVGFGISILEGLGAGNTAPLQNLTKFLQEMDARDTVTAIKAIGTVLNWAIIKPIEGLVNLLNWIAEGITNVINSFSQLKKSGLSGLLKFGASILGRGIGSTMLDMITSQGTDTAMDAASSVSPPNRSSLEAQKINFEGLLNIQGAPKGSSFENNSNKGSPPFRVELLGAQ
jgi:TP901 family phage tail tape measure protein